MSFASAALIASALSASAASSDVRPNMGIVDRWKEGRWKEGRKLLTDLQRGQGTANLEICTLDGCAPCFAAIRAKDGWHA